MDRHADLWARYRQGDKSAYEALVEAYLPMVKTTVGRMSMTIPRYVSKEELFSAGSMGLLSAIERYDPDREAQFTTYAITRIRGAILDELRHHDVLGRVTRERVTRIHEAEQELLNNDQITSPDVVAEKAGLTMDEYWDAEIGAMATRQISLNESADQSGQPLQELLSSRNAEIPGQEMEAEELIETVENLLNEKEKNLVVLYYKEDLTLKEIGTLLDVSESRVCQIHAAMIKRIRKELKKRGIFV